LKTDISDIVQEFDNSLFDLNETLLPEAPHVSLHQYGHAMDHEPEIPLDTSILQLPNLLASKHLLPNSIPESAILLFYSINAALKTKHHGYIFFNFGYFLPCFSPQWSIFGYFIPHFFPQWSIFPHYNLEIMEDLESMEDDQKCLEGQNKISLGQLCTDPVLV
jgi:hypothetical protein